MSRADATMRHRVGMLGTLPLADNSETSRFLRLCEEHRMDT